jgi:uncharacterized protein Usg
MIILRYPELVTTRVIYFIPRTHILQTFCWQCDDIAPEFPRVHRFLNYWHEEIDAVISEVLVMAGKRDWRAIDFEIG